MFRRNPKMCFYSFFFTCFCFSTWDLFPGWPGNLIPPIRLGQRYPDPHPLNLQDDMRAIARASVMESQGLGNGSHVWCESYSPKMSQILGMYPPVNWLRYGKTTVSRSWTFAGTSMDVHIGVVIWPEAAPSRANRTVQEQLVDSWSYLLRIDSAWGQSIIYKEKSFGGRLWMFRIGPECQWYLYIYIDTTLHIYIYIYIIL